MKTYKRVRSLPSEGEAGRVTPFVPGWGEREAARREVRRPAIPSGRSPAPPRIVICALLVAFAAIAALAAEVDTSSLPPASTQQGVTFAKDIKPIFDKACVACHSAEKPKGKLRLDTLEGTMKGSIDHKVVEPGNSAKSILVQNIGFIGDEDTWMPPPGNTNKIDALTKDEIGLIRAWIDQGAK